MKKLLIAGLWLSLCLLAAPSAEARKKAHKQKEKTGFAKINLNTAPAAELKKIPGISSTQAKRIVSYREENGELKSVDDLKNISHETKSGKTSYDFATKSGKWKSKMKPLIEKNIFTVKGGVESVDRNALYLYLYPRPADINTATLEELKSLPGISKKKALQIIDNRPYSSLAGLKDISHETKSGKTRYDFATSKGKWTKKIRILLESKRLVCKKVSQKKRGKKKVKKAEESENYDEEY